MSMNKFMADVDDLIFDGCLFEGAKNFDHA